MRDRWVTETMGYNHQPDYVNKVLGNFVDYLNRSLNLGINPPEKTRVMCREVYLAQGDGIIIRTTQNNRHNNQLIVSVNSKTCPGLAKRIADSGLIKAFPAFDFKR